MKQLLRTIKRLPLYALYGRWRTKSAFVAGYTIALPMPMDMPFLLRLALEGLAAIDTPNCDQILVVPDGWGNDKGMALRQVMEEFDDPRLEIVDLRDIDYTAIRAMRPPGCARTHWMMVVNSVLHARHEFVFLHDADAFFLEANGLEKQYEEAKTRNMEVLGVTPRWDPFFSERDMQIAGTWEMLFSTRWARKRSPMALFPGKWPTAYGDFGFDSMLYAQFLDHERGTIGVMKEPPKFVHFNGTIFTYRSFRDRGEQQVTDELFRILLLSLLESVIGVPDADRATPPLSELLRGLSDPTAPVLYQSDINARGYAEFRTMVERMNESPAFVGERATIIRKHLRGFDEYFRFDASHAFQPAIEVGLERLHGLNPQK